MAVLREIVLFHSAYGLRPAVLQAAARLRALGLRVRTPDLFDGRVVDSLPAAIALRDRIGRDELLRRAREAVADAPPGTVLAGLSLGASLAQRLAARDARFTRLLLLHGTAAPPERLPAPWQVQAHLAEEDPLEPVAEVRGWSRRLADLGARVELHLHRGGHLFTDPELPDHDAASAAATWSLAERFLTG